MSLGLCFWILMLIWLVFGVVVRFGMIGGPWAANGDWLLLFVLFLLLGWETFGAPLHK
jgi:hypothetical protein